MKKRSLVRVSIALLVLLYVYTASSKLFDIEAFKGNMYNQQVPHWLADLLIWTIPSSEMAIVICLLFEGTQRRGLYGSLALLSIYTLYIIAILLHFFRKMPCPCGGILPHLGWEAHLWFNLLFIMLTVFALRHRIIHP